MAKVEVVMPQMGESVMEGTVIEWSKQLGDAVEVDETLLEIATDKVDTEVPSPEAGVLVEILVQADETVAVGQPIAVIDTDPNAVPVDAAGGSGATDAGSEGADAGVSESGGESAGADVAVEVGSAGVSGVSTAGANGTGSAVANGAGSNGSGSSSASGEVIEVEMPQMGESVMEGTVIAWAKSVGDTVEVDETLLEIATDKVDTEVPSPASGTIVEIRVQADETVEVGQVIALIATGEGAVAGAAAGAGAGTGAAAGVGAGAEAGTGTGATTSASQGAAIPRPEDLMVSAPSNGHSSRPEVDSRPQRIGSDGRFFSPLVRSIAEQEGVTQQELESIAGSGQGGRINKSDLMTYLEDRKAGRVPATAAGTAGAASASPQTKTIGLVKPTSQSAGQAAQGQTSGAGTASGAGKIQAGELNVTSPQQNVEIIKMDRMRKMIAEHMVRSKQTSAHVSTFSEVDVTNIVQWRNANKGKFQKQTGVRLTFTPIFVEAFIKAIGEFPLINSSVEGDEIHVKKAINFGIAVALGQGGTGGLIVPVIKNAQDKNLIGLAKAINDLASKARNKELSPDDLFGGTITLTNYGSVGNLMGTPIINQPQVAILGTGVIQKRPVVMETEVGDMIAIRHMMYLTMSYDHRIIDGAHGGAFTSRVKQLLEDFDPNRAF
jgi:pyruvate/2-oxoglutarate dehydrogenase complex dihydrolipoamide acyltransferase (E2) component